MRVTPPGQGRYQADEPCRGPECPCHDDRHECFPGGTDGTLRCIYPLDYDHEAAERWDAWRAGSYRLTIRSILGQV